MKIYFKHPDGWKFDFQLDPIDRDKLYVICATIAGCVVALAFFSMFK